MKVLTQSSKIGRVCMLGWEYPPHISGGLGTACYGLTRALSAQQVPLTFIVPRLYGNEDDRHLTLLSGSDMVRELVSERSTISSQRSASSTERTTSCSSEISQPYPGSYTRPLSGVTRSARVLSETEYLLKQEYLSSISPEASNESYSDEATDLFSAVAEYTRNATRYTPPQDTVLIHSHDWMTFSAGIALKKKTGLPLVVHVHSLESDRSGGQPCPTIATIEKTGCEQADCIVAVSEYTAALITRDYQIPREKIQVVHNGIESDHAPALKADRGSTLLTRSEDKPRVLFLGRVTSQKGPLGFVQAAERVLQSNPDVTFVMAGNGDMLNQCKRYVSDAGLRNSFEFPGFLRGAAVDREYQRADLFVLPSVSEPFGITALEAIKQGVPVLLSKQAGVSEVINSALLFDFWDIERLARLITGCLHYKEVREEMSALAYRELSGLHWNNSAQRLLGVYAQQHFGKQSSFASYGTQHA